ncbi:MAG: ACP S-malonyltransferase [Planctomycetota bacterium]
MSRIACMFPGQGAQAVGMGRTLVERSSIARSIFDRANAVLGFDLAELCFNGPAERLDETDISQPALYVASLAALEVLRSESPAVLDDCCCVAGLSLGEYTALTFAGVLDFEDGLGIVRERGLAMQAAAEMVAGGMVSILGWERDRVEALCAEVRQPGEVLQVANLLCPGNIVISGGKEACQRAAESATQAGAMKAIPLKVAGAFHTELMRPAVDRLTAALANVPLRAPRIPVVSNVDALPHNDPEEIRQLLVSQVVSVVRWEDSVRWMMANQCDSFYEIGPGRVLAGLLKRIDRKLKCENTAT